VRSVPLTTGCTRHDLLSLATGYRAAVDPMHLNALARSLGLSIESLTALGIGWSAYYRAWSFPMTDAAGAVVGIRLRRTDGRKFAVRGGHEGLFAPTQVLTTAHAEPGSLIVCEGPTDAAALLHVGFVAVVGRPSCTGGVKLLVELAQRRRPTEIILVADGDEPGRRGAGDLASVLVAYVAAVRVITPPAGIKDARDWLRAGATRADMEAAIAAAAARRLAFRAVAVRKGC
jgi:phage/plasmid primase-like uncharacterized protein